MTVSNDLVKFVGKKEGFEATPYWDHKQWSYGYGEKVPGSSESASNPPPAGTRISESIASSNMEAKLQVRQDGISQKYSDYNFTQNELDALTSFHYNVGNVDQLTNDGQRTKAEIASKMLEYNKASKKPVASLTDRRYQESQLFRTPQDATATANTYDEIITNKPTARTASSLPPVSSTASQVGPNGIVHGPVPKGGTNGRLLPNGEIITTKSAIDAQNAIRGAAVADRDTAYFDSIKKEETDPDSVFDSMDAFNEAKIPTSNDVFVMPWAPTPNRFQQFSTMTYAVSIYSLTTPQYDKILEQSLKDVSGYTLMMQSGGAEHAGKAGTFGAIRSEFFEEDFYLDNIQFQSVIAGESTGAVTNDYLLNFTIAEPAGISLFKRINQMIAKQSPEMKNFTSHDFLMVVRFYGYDENGMPVKGTDLPSMGGASDPNSASEKFIPFRFKGITFRLADEQVIYSCEAYATGVQLGNDKTHGAIPGNYRLQGATIDEILNGDGKLIQGLIPSLNAYQKNLKDENVIKEPDEYEIIFHPKIKPASINVLIGGGDGTATPLQTTGMYLRKNGINHYDNKTGAVIISKKWFTTNPGMKITKFIDVLMQASSYVYDQQPSDTDAVTSDVKIKGQTESHKWFKIQTKAIPLPKTDSKKNDYAYKISYYVSPYWYTPESVYTESEKNKCFSIHKTYDYWFTGKNTEVLDFKQDFKYLYYKSMARDHGQGDMKVNSISPTQRSNYFADNTGTENYGQNKRNDISSNEAGELYSKGDQAVSEFTIVGDPDWITQGEIFYGPGQQLSSGKMLAPFLEDGTVNHNASEIFFTINYNTVVDYDITTGLADVTNGTGASKYAFVYKAIKITTELDGGGFTQKLHGVLKDIPVSCIYSNQVAESLHTPGKAQPGLGEGANRTQGRESTAPNKAIDIATSGSNSNIPSPFISPAFNVDNTMSPLTSFSGIASQFGDSLDEALNAGSLVNTALGGIPAAVSGIAAEVGQVVGNSTEGLTGLIGGVKGAVNDITNSVGAITGAVSDLAENAVAGLFNNVSGPLENMSGAVSDIFTATGEISGIIAQGSMGVVDTIIGEAVTGINTATNNIASNMTDINNGQEVGTTLSDIVSHTNDITAETVKITNAVSGTINSAVNATVTTVTNTASVVASNVNSFTSGVFTSVTKPQTDTTIASAEDPFDGPNYG